ncbi:MAG: ATP-dependent Clp protease proteolytic subunit, partial [Coprobacillus sp.]|nr:ATP-dependent Clp protease proteolytic subunit [Coprobacillus sp.]
MERERVLIDFRGVIDDWGDYGKDESGVWRASSLAGVRMAVESSPKGSDIVLNIDSDGGSVSEGLKIYDYLTTYDYEGGQLYTNIVGGCHSMAVVVLLTAPLANRSANANIRALIHEVRTWGDDITVEEAERLAKQLQMEQDAILDIYAARTTSKRKDLEAIMKAETEHTAQELLDWGFISSINSLSVNAYLRNKKRLNNSNMAKSTEFYNKFVKGLRAFVNKTNNCEVSNYDYTDADGVIVFSTEGEEDNLAVGVSVVLSNGETGGTYVLNDGRVVTIVDNIVTEIVEAANEKNEGDPAP